MSIRVGCVRTEQAKFTNPIYEIQINMLKCVEIKEQFYFFKISPFSYWENEFKIKNPTI